MSKGLEALEYISHFTNFQNGYYKDKLDSIEKELKALEIILKEFRFTFDDEEQSVMIDNCYTVIFHNKEKYDLLKEVLL